LRCWRCTIGNAATSLAKLLNLMRLSVAALSARALLLPRIGLSHLSFSQSQSCVRLRLRYIGTEIAVNIQQSS